MHKGVTNQACACVCALSSCLLVPEATVLLIAEIDELYSQGCLPLWLHMKAGWFSSKPRSPLCHEVAAAETSLLSCSSCRIGHSGHIFDLFFFFFSLSNSIHVIHPPSSQSELLAAWSNIIQNWFYSRPFWQNVLSLQGLLHHSLGFFSSSRASTQCFHTQTYEKADPGESVMFSLYPSQVQEAWRGSAVTGWMWKMHLCMSTGGAAVTMRLTPSWLRCWEAEAAMLHRDIKSAETTCRSLSSQSYLHFKCGSLCSCNHM